MPNILACRHANLFNHGLFLFSNDGQFSAETTVDPFPRMTGCLPLKLRIDFSSAISGYSPLELWVVPSKITGRYPLCTTCV